MTNRIASAIAAIAITVSASALVAPAATAEPIAPVPTTDAFGSVALCFTIPLGVFAFSICI